MTLFDPYSHMRLRELRQEELVRKARQRAALEAARGTDSPGFAAALLRRIRRERPAAAQPRPGRAALDS